MDFLGNILQITFIFIVFRTIIMLIASITMSKKMKDKMKNSQIENTTDSRANDIETDNAQKPATVTIEMVKDHLCGSFVPKNKAFIVRTDGEDYYFCSWECREKFAGQAGN